MTRPAWSSLAAVAMLLSACAHLDPEDRAPRTDPVARLSPSGPSPWQVDFEDPALSDLLRGADLGALDIKIALARLARARADVAEARAQRAPHVSIGAEGAVGGVDFHDARSAATPAFEATYEVDLWGRLARGEDAAVHDQAAADADVAAARLLVAADTVRAFAALRSAQDAIEGYAHRKELASRALALTQRRASEGAAEPGAVGAAQLALDRAGAGLEAAREDEKLEVATLGDLLGRPGIAVPLGPPLAEDRAVPTTGSEIIANRPDVRAAFARLQAADARRAQAVASSRPQLQLSALLGAPDAAIATLLDVRSLAWAVAASLSHSLLDGGAARARVHAAGADADVADLQYRKAVLAGWSDVRTALVDQARARRELAAARTAKALAGDSVRLQAARHREGATDGLDTVAAGVAVEAAQDQLRAARLAAVEARVRIALATGGL